MAQIAIEIVNFIDRLYTTFYENASPKCKDVTRVMPLPNNKVLFVDDDVALTDTAKDALPIYGFTVYAANSADIALQMLKDGLRPAVMCTDIVMPGGTGVNLAKEVSHSYPEIKILLVTGSDDQVTSSNTRSGFEVMGKPYLFSSLSRKLTQLLETPTGD